MLNEGPWTVWGNIGERATRPGGCCGQDQRLEVRNKAGWSPGGERGRSRALGGGRERRAPCRGGRGNFRISILSGGPFPVPFLSPVEMPTLSQPQIKALPNGNTPLGPPTSFQPVRILAVIFNLFYLFSHPPPNPWAPPGSQRDRNGSKFPSMTPVKACKTIRHYGWVTGCSPHS